MQTAAFSHPLTSNGIPLDMSPARLGRLLPSDPAEPVETFRERLAHDGYLWVKGLLPHDKALAFRRCYFAAMEDAGLLRAGSDPADGLYGGGEDRHRLAMLHREFVQRADYEAFCLSEPLVRFFTAFFGEPVMLYKRKLIRHTKPGDPACTGAHYDLTYLRGATERVLTAWIPIGDTPAEQGGLVYLEGSDAVGRRLEAEHRERYQELSEEERVRAYNDDMAVSGWITKNLPELADRADSRWLAADYEAGDVVIHTAHMIHASTQNDDPSGRMRLSTDIRYQPVRDRIDRRWGEHWSPDDML
jgi:ectoine hydroxylase-related dioxygenase (phytanoyl-CoA dioxygenase family)